LVQAETAAERTGQAAEGAEEEVQGAREFDEECFYWWSAWT
jgi:hypothetical protein